MQKKIFNHFFSRAKTFTRFRNMRGLLCAVLFLNMTAAECTAETAFDAFHLLTETAAENNNSQNNTVKAYSLLEVFILNMTEGSMRTDSRLQMPSEEFLASITDPAASITLLSSLSDADLTRFSAEHKIPPAFVRNGYYKALACLIRAAMQREPEALSTYQNMETIIALFLIDGNTDLSPEDQSAQETIRSEMTPAYSRQLAQVLGLPASFVEYVIMDTSLASDDWASSRDWAQIRTELETRDRNASAADTSSPGDAAGVLPENAFVDMPIGSKDSADSSYIRTMQETLIRLGYLGGSADGIFGPRTQAALIEYQLANGLNPSGYYRFSDYISLQSAEAVARSAYHDDFWDEDDYCPEYRFDYRTYMSGLNVTGRYGESDDDDDDRYEYDDDDRYEYGDDDRYEYDDDDRYEYDDDDRYEYDDDDRYEYDDDDRYEYDNDDDDD